MGYHKENLQVRVDNVKTAGGALFLDHISWFGSEGVFRINTKTN